MVGYKWGYVTEMVPFVKLMHHVHHFDLASRTNPNAEEKEPTFMVLRLLWGKNPLPLPCDGLYLEISSEVWHVSLT